MLLRSLGFAAAVAALVSPCAAFAQQKLKFAHVYETGEPYHKWAVWAGGEIAKRTANRYSMDVFPASALGNETRLSRHLFGAAADVFVDESPADGVMDDLDGDGRITARDAERLKQSLRREAAR